MREPFDIVQHEYLLKSSRKRGDRCLEVETINAIRVERHRRRRIDQLVDVDLVPIDVDSLAPARAVALANTVDQNAGDPRPKRRAPLESAERFDCSHPGVVHDVSGNVCIPRQANSRVVQSRGVTAIERLERARVAGARQSIEQRTVGVGVVRGFRHSIG